MPTTLTLPALLSNSARVSFQELEQCWLWGGRGDPVFNNGYGFNRTRMTAGLFCNLTEGLKLREME